MGDIRERHEVTQLRDFFEGLRRVLTATGRAAPTAPVAPAAIRPPARAASPAAGPTIPKKGTR